MFYNDFGENNINIVIDVIDIEIKNNKTYNNTISNSFMTSLNLSSFIIP